MRRMQQDKFFRFLKHYSHLSSRSYSGALTELRRRGTEKLKEKIAKKIG